MKATETKVPLPGMYAILSKRGEVVSLDGLSPIEAYLKLTGDDPLTIYAADLVVHFRGGYISALDTFTGEVAKKSHTPEMGERLLKLLISDNEDWVRLVSYEGAEEFFADFPVRFIP